MTVSTKGNIDITCSGYTCLVNELISIAACVNPPIEVARARIPNSDRNIARDVSVRDIQPQGYPSRVKW